MASKIGSFNPTAFALYPGKMSEQTALYIKYMSFRSEILLWCFCVSMDTSIDHLLSDKATCSVRKKDKLAKNQQVCNSICLVLRSVKK